MQFEKAKTYILRRLQKELPKHLSYHSIWHTKDVYNSAMVIAEHEGIKGIDLKLLLTACMYHDSGFLQQNKNHEMLSCNIAKENLPKYNYTEEEIQVICGMIMATKLPQSPKNLMEEIICDADLDYLGRDDFFTIGNRLYLELKVYGLIKNEIEWDKLQISFLESHHYFTKTAIHLRKAKKDEHIAELKANNNK